MNKNFGSAFLEYLKVNELPQKLVADRTGIAPATINRLLRTAEPEMSTVSKIAKGLKISIRVTPDGVVFDPLVLVGPTEQRVYSIPNSHNRVGVELSMQGYQDIDGESKSHPFFRAEFLFKEGAKEAWDYSYERLDYRPNCWSDASLLKWARAAANNRWLAGCERNDK